VIEVADRTKPPRAELIENGGVVDGTFPVLVCSEFSPDWTYTNSVLPTREALQSELTARTRQLHFIPLLGREASSYQSANTLTYYNSQGREFSTVIALVPFSTAFDTNAALYTAATRASKRLVFIGPLENIASMLNRMEPEKRSIDGALLSSVWDHYKDRVTKPDLRTAAEIEIQEAGKYGTRAKGETLVDLYVNARREETPDYDAAQFMNECNRDEKKNPTSATEELTFIDRESVDYQNWSSGKRTESVMALRAMKEARHDALSVLDGVDFDEDITDGIE